MISNHIFLFLFLSFPTARARPLPLLLPSIPLVSSLKLLVVSYCGPPSEARRQPAPEEGSERGKGQEGDRGRSLFAGESSSQADGQTEAVLHPSIRLGLNLICRWGGGGGVGFQPESAGRRNGGIRTGAAAAAAVSFCTRQSADTKSHGVLSRDWWGRGRRNPSHCLPPVY